MYATGILCTALLVGSSRAAVVIPKEHGGVQIVLNFVLDSYAVFRLMLF